MQQFGIMYTTVGKGDLLQHFILSLFQVQDYFRKKVWIIRLDQCCDRFRWTLFFMHYGRIFDWKRGYLCIFRCNCIFDSYFSDRLFLLQFIDGVKCHVFMILSAGFFVLFQ